MLIMKSLIHIINFKNILVYLNFIILVLIINFNKKNILLST